MWRNGLVCNGRTSDEVYYPCILINLLIALGQLPPVHRQLRRLQDDSSSAAAFTLSCFIVAIASWYVWIAFLVLGWRIACFTAAVKSQRKKMETAASAHANEIFSCRLRRLYVSQSSGSSVMWALRFLMTTSRGVVASSFRTNGFSTSESRTIALPWCSPCTSVSETDRVTMGLGSRMVASTASGAGALNGVSTNE
jgi:hypothetical protein